MMVRHRPIPHAHELKDTAEHKHVTNITKGQGFFTQYNFQLTFEHMFRLSEALIQVRIFQEYANIRELCPHGH